jgi:hypothetical protein
VYPQVASDFANCVSVARRDKWHVRLGLLGLSRLDSQSPILRRFDESLAAPWEGAVWAAGPEKYVSHSSTNVLEQSVLDGHRTAGGGGGQ